MEDSTLPPRRDDVGTARTQSYPGILIDTGLKLASASSLAAIAEMALDAGLKLSGGEFGVCCYRDGQPEGVAGPKFKVLGRGPDGILSPRNFVGQPPLTTFFQMKNAGPAGDPLPDSGICHDFPLTAFLPELRPAHSCCGSLIRSREGKEFGALIYGHSRPEAFGEAAEMLVTALGVQVGLAMDHLLLRERCMQHATGAEQARKEQRDTAHRLKHVLEAAQLGTWTWDAATGMVHFDERAAEFFGVSAEIPIPRNKLREHIVHPEDLHRSPSDLRAILTAGGKYTAEYRVRSADGEERWIAANGNPSNGSGQERFTGMIGTLQDITSRKQQEAALRTSEKLAATGRLAATIAHEINNPLEAVTNLIYLAKTDPIAPQAVRHMLETADRELARVSQIAQQTLGFYRDTSRPVSVDLNNLLQAVVDLFDRKLTGKRLQCTMDLEPGLSVIGLQGEIRQVMSNLLVNAIDASEENGGRIHIRARRRRRLGDRGVSMLISDSGGGIPHGVRHRLFTPFTTTKESLGTGLGLWVTQGMVEKHGGSVRFRSRTETPSGTVFRVYLPESGSPRLFAHQSSTVLQ